MEENKIATTEPLTKKEKNSLFWKYMLTVIYCCNFETWHGNVFAYNLYPLFKKYYKDSKEKIVEGMKRHLDFYNNEVASGAIVWGIMVGMEEQKALGKNVDPELIRTTKTALMGPIAGIGDSLIQGTVLPLLLTIAITITGANYSPLGPIFYLIATPVLLYTYAHFLFDKGYSFGAKAVTMITGGALEHIRKAIQIFGVILIGALSANYVGLKTSLTFSAGADATPTVIQDVLDKIFPNMLSLFLVLVCYYLVTKKNVKIVHLILILMIGTVALALIGIL